MSSTASARLYTPELLALAVELANVPLHPGLALHGEARSRSCGSVVTVGLDLAPDGTIIALGLRATTCAVGQAAAAIFVKGASGKEVAAIRQTRADLEKWLYRQGPRPDWPCLAALDAALDHPGRHGAIMLPWRAAEAALCNHDAAS